jgi:hypothetical protein
VCFEDGVRCFVDLKKNTYRLFYLCQF